MNRASALSATVLASLCCIAGCSTDAPIPPSAVTDAGAPDLHTPADLSEPALDLLPLTHTGVVDPMGKGGTVSLLNFTAFGDIRPSLPDIDSLYPDAVVQSIMKGMVALEPEFAVGTGDYMFVEYLASSAKNQLMRLRGDEAFFTAPIFHALGNHECESFSDVNCPNLNESANIKAFMPALLSWTPVPYFAFTVHTALGDAKFVFVAVNAWTSDQATWLTKTMVAPTRYTFVIRHHPTPDAGMASTAEGKLASDAILAAFPVTLFIYGHVHEYNHVAPNAVVTGNAGAPLDAGDYGYLQVLQRPDGNIAVTEYKEGSNSPIDNWAVTPEGMPAQ